MKVILSRVKIGFFVSNVSVGNIILSRELHVGPGCSELHRV
jgi:hypothetical protein